MSFVLSEATQWRQPYANRQQARGRFVCSSFRRSPSPVSVQAGQQQQELARQAEGQQQLGADKDRQPHGPQAACRRTLISALGGCAVLASWHAFPMPAVAEDDASAPPAEVSPTVTAVADDDAAVAAEAPSTSSPAPSSGSSRSSGPQVFFDVAIEGEPVGRIVVELFNDVKVGSARFRDLAQGKQGVGYRLSRIDGIFDTHLRVESVKRLSYSATGDSSITGGDSVAELEAEMEAPAHAHDGAALVSLMVKEATDRPVTEKLVAKNGKLVTIQMQAGEAPNGTGFMITRGPAPALDRTNLVVGRVVQGMDVVERVAGLPFSKPRVEWYDGPFFEAGKAIGDKRAVVAEKGFNRPFKRVIITASGVVA